MNNSCNKTIKIDTRSTFALELNFFDENGNILDPHLLEFKISYSDSRRNKYEVSNMNGVRTNNFIKDNRLFARFENYNLRAGQLKREVYIKQTIVPDEGQGFDNNEMLQVINDYSVVHLVDGDINYPLSNCETVGGYCFIGVESFQFPCVEYLGVATPQSELIVNDFIANKHLIAEAINAKGGEADKTDSIAELAEDILNLVPAEITFQTSGNLNPRWSDLQAKIAKNYREDRKHAWAFSFLGKTPTIELTGGDYYICSDGYETAQSGAHTFGVNLEENKTDNWVIIYTQSPTFIFPESIAPYIVGVVFYKTSPENVLLYGTKAAFLAIDSDNEIGDTLSLRESFARGTAINYFNVPQGVENLNLGMVAFGDCRGLVSFYSGKMKNISFGSGAFQYCSSIQFLSFIAQTATVNESVFYGATFKNLHLKMDNELTLNNNALNGIAGSEITLEASKISFLGYAFRAAVIDKLFIKASDTLARTGYTLLGSTIKYVYLSSPKTAFTQPDFYDSNISEIELEKGFSWSISVSQIARFLSRENFIRNIDAYADRTNLTPLTYSIGAAYVNSLQSVYVTYDENKNITAWYDSTEVTPPADAMPVIQFFNNVKNNNIA